MKLDAANPQAPETATSAADENKNVVAAVSTEDIKALKPGTPEYDAAMVAVARQSRGEAQPEAPKTESTPAKSPTDDASGVPDKFKNADGTVNTAALLKSYSELERRQSTKAPAAETPPVAPVVAPKVDAQADPVMAAAQVAEAEFLEKGELSEATLKALTDKGIPKALVESFVANAKLAQAGKQATEDAAKAQAAAAQQADQVEILATIGGTDGWAKLNTWAAANLAQDELNALQEQLDASKASAKFALKHLNGLMQAAVGVAPKLVTGAPSANSTDIFTTKDQYLAAMASPDYKKSEAYRQSVYTKLARSRSAGQNW